MGRSQRIKGANFERKIARMFAEDMPGAGVCRGLAQTRSGADCADVETPRFWVECKRRKRGNIRAALKQAAEAATPDRSPLAIIKDDRKPAVVGLWLDDWNDFIVELAAGGYVPKSERKTKRGKKPAAMLSHEANAENARPGFMPVTEIAGQGFPPFVMLYLDDFRECLRIWWKSGNS